MMEHMVCNELNRNNCSFDSARCSIYLTVYPLLFILSQSFSIILYITRSVHPRKAISVRALKVMYA